MSTPTPENAYPAPEDRVYPAERAYGPQRDTPAWKRIGPDLSEGYEEVHLALDCEHPDYTFEDVTSS